MRWSLKQTRGCPQKVAWEDQVLICLTFWREYRTYFHIAQDWLLCESTVCRIAHRVETTLVSSGKFRLKVFRILSQRYRNQRKRFGLRCHLIVGIYNYELEKA